MSDRHNEWTRKRKEERMMDAERAIRNNAIDFKTAMTIHLAPELDIIHTVNKCESHYYG